MGQTDWSPTTASIGNKDSDMSPASSDDDITSTSSQTSLGHRMEEDLLRHCAGHVLMNAGSFTSRVIRLTALVTMVVLTWCSLYEELLKQKLLPDLVDVIIHVLCLFLGTEVIIIWLCGSMSYGRAYGCAIVNVFCLLGSLALVVGTVVFHFRHGQYEFHSFESYPIDYYRAIWGSVMMIIDDSIRSQRRVFANAEEQLEHDTVDCQAVLDAVSAVPELSPDKCKILKSLARKVDEERRGAGHVDRRGPSGGAVWSGRHVRRFLDLAAATLKIEFATDWWEVNDLLLQLVVSLGRSQSVVGVRSMVHDQAYGIGRSAVSIISHFASGSFGHFQLFCWMCILNALRIPVTALLISLMTQHAQDLNFPEALRDAGLYLGVNLLSVLLWSGISYVYSVVIASAMSRLQTRVASSMINLSASDHDAYPNGIVNAVFSSDIARMDSAWVSASFGFLLSAPELVLAVGYATYVAPPVGVLAITVFPFIFTTVPQARAATAGRATAKAQAKTITVFQNGVACQRMVWSCDGQAQWLNDYFRPAVEVQHARQFTSRGLGSIVNAHIVQLVNLFIAVHVAILACLAAQGLITVGELTGLVSLFTSLSSPASKIGTFMRQAADCAGSAQRLDSFLTEAEGDCGACVGRCDSYEAGVGNSLELSEIGFTYPDAMAPSIRPSSLVIPPGTFAAIVGGSGCGKSTLLSLITTWRQPSAGGLSWGPNMRLQAGASDSEAVARCLRNNTAVVFQEMMILDGSVHDNIAFGASPFTSREDVEWAAAAAGCTEFVSAALTEGYDSVLGSGGASLSGGQAQRICIARALCRKPNLLLMDEATSALDPNTTEEVLRTISGLRQNYPEQFCSLTIVLITHNPDALKHVDLVVEMAAGSVVSCTWQRDRPRDTPTEAAWGS